MASSIGMVKCILRIYSWDSHSFMCEREIIDSLHCSLLINAGIVQSDVARLEPSVRILKWLFDKSLSIVIFITGCGSFLRYNSNKWGSYF